MGFGCFLKKALGLSVGLGVLNGVGQMMTGNIFGGLRSIIAACSAGLLMKAMGGHKLHKQFCDTLGHMGTHAAQNHLPFMMAGSTGAGLLALQQMQTQGQLSSCLYKKISCHRDFQKGLEQADKAFQKLLDSLKHQQSQHQHCHGSKPVYCMTKDIKPCHWS